jgi:hypothetical protein
MKKVVLVLAVTFVGFASNAQSIIKQSISKEPETDLNREVVWSLMIENLRNDVYELQLLCKTLKPNGKVLYEKMVTYSTSSAKKYKMTSATTWNKIDDTSPNWNDTTYIPEYKFFFRLMNKTVKSGKDEDLKKAIISNLDNIDKLFDK